MRLFALTIVAFAAFHPGAHAQTIYFNENFATGTQTGTLAPQTLTLDGIASIATGPNGSNNLELPAWGNSSGTSAVLGGSNLSLIGQPLDISLNAIPSADVVDAGLPWLAFSLGTTSQENTFVTNQTLSVLYRSNGGFQILDGGSDTADGTWGSQTNGSTYYNLSILLTNTAGSGSAFNGTGSKVSLYSGTTLIDTTALTQLTSTQGYLTLESTGSNGNAFVSSMNISNADPLTAPEPSTWALMLIGAGVVVVASLRQRSEPPGLRS